MSCCEPQSRRDFLNSKLANFRAFVAPYCLTDELQQRLAEYKDMDTVMPVLLQAVAMKQVGQLESMIQTFCDAFPVPGEEREAFDTKVGRYITMFVEVFTS